MHLWRSMHLQRSMQQRTLDGREGRDARQVLNKDGALGKFPQVLKQESTENWCRCSHVGRRLRPSWEALLRNGTIAFFSRREFKINEKV